MWSVNKETRKRWTASLYGQNLSVSESHGFTIYTVHCKDYAEKKICNLKIASGFYIPINAVAGYYFKGSSKLQAYKGK